MVRHLVQRFPMGGIKAKALTEVDRPEYERLQSLVAKEIMEDFNLEIYPVQYDDIFFRRLNRVGSNSAL
jgi:hypothetical protein